MKGISRPRVDNFDWQLATYILPIAIIIFYAITLTGCLPGLENVFLLQLQAQSDNETLVRVGYFGVCAGSGNNFACLSTHHATASALSTRFTLLARINLASVDAGATPTLTKLLAVALDLQSKQVICLLAPAGVLFVLSLLPLTLFRRSLKRPQNFAATSRAFRIRHAALGSVWASVVLALISAVMVESSTSAFQYATSTEFGADIRMTTGPALPAFQWVILGLSAMYGFGVTSILKMGDGSGHSAGYMPVGASMQTQASGFGLRRQASMFVPLLLPVGNR